MWFGGCLKRIVVKRALFIKRIATKRLKYSARYRFRRLGGYREHNALHYAYAEPAECHGSGEDFYASVKIMVQRIQLRLFSTNTVTQHQADFP